MEGMIPPELLKWADLGLILLVVIFSRIVAAWLSPGHGDQGTGFAAFDGDRVLVIPLIVGLVVGLLIEWSTPEFDLNMAIRRVLTCGGVGALAFKYLPDSITGARR